jgi:hypothetical protein
MIAAHVLGAKCQPPTDSFLGIALTGWVQIVLCVITTGWVMDDIFPISLNLIKQETRSFLLIIGELML